MKSFVSVLALAISLGAATSAQANEAIIKKARCVACHAVDKKLVGPAYKDVAEKYRGDTAAAGKLAAKIRHGGAGVWGEIPMTPNGPDKINDADLALAVEWILSLK